MSKGQPNGSWLLRGTGQEGWGLLAHWGWQACGADDIANKEVPVWVSGQPFHSEYQNFKSQGGSVCWKIQYPFQAAAEVFCFGFLEFPSLLAFPGINWWINGMLSLPLAPTSAHFLKDWEGPEGSHVSGVSFSKWMSFLFPQRGIVRIQRG